MSKTGLGPERRYANVVAHLRCYPGVKVTVLKERGLAPTALSVQGQIFAMLSTTGELILKLPSAPPAALTLSEWRRRSLPTQNAPVGGWVVVRDDLKDEWLTLAEAARYFAISNAGPGSLGQ